MFSLDWKDVTILSTISLPSSLKLEFKSKLMYLDWLPWENSEFGIENHSSLDSTTLIPIYRNNEMIYALKRMLSA